MINLKDDIKPMLKSSDENDIKLAIGILNTFTINTDQVQALLCIYKAWNESYLMEDTRESNWLHMGRFSTLIHEHLDHIVYRNSLQYFGYPLTRNPFYANRLINYLNTRNVKITVY
jgi:hypothetical protein